MLNEPHYPSRWSVIAVFLTISLLIAGVFAWAFYFNFGTLVVNSDEAFLLDASGDTFACIGGDCEISLSPGQYNIVASQEGHYPEEFELTVARWEKIVKNIEFTLIPYLQATGSENIPEEVSGDVYLRDSEETMDLMSGDQLITSFDSLSAPVLQSGGTNAVIFDSGRLFFVDLETGRKTRRFDDTVDVRAARLSDNGEKVLLFVELDGLNFIWVWLNESDELLTYDVYAEPNLIQWEAGRDYRIFIISDQLTESEPGSVFEESVGLLGEGTSQMSLFRYNLDSGEILKIADLGDKEARRLIRRGDRYFIEYAGDRYEELVVK